MSAVFSPCRNYRYRLDRPVADAGIVIAFFGVNPSTAAEDEEDSTTRKWRGFCKVNGARRYIAGNPFAYISTDVRRLSEVTDPIGPDNLRHTAAIIEDADLLVPCWGNRSKLPPKLRPHLHSLEFVLRASGKPMKIFGLTKSGDPMHPLMLGYGTPLVQWPSARSQSDAAEKASNECKAVFAFVEPPRYSPAMCPHGVKWGFGECSQCDAAANAVPKKGNV